MSARTVIYVAVMISGCVAGPRPAPPQQAAAAPTPAAPPAVREERIPDRELGLCKTSVFEVPDPTPFDYAKAGPGGNGRIARAYALAPPRIPHKISNFVPITLSRNRCLDCHDAAPSDDPEEPTAIPSSHRIDWRNAPGLEGKEVAGARFLCTACHVPQAQFEPPIASGFQP